MIFKSISDNARRVQEATRMSVPIVNYWLYLQLFIKGKVYTIYDTLKPQSEMIEKVSRRRPSIVRCYNCDNNLPAKLYKQTLK